MPIYEINGSKVEFKNEPTHEDIDEAAAHLSISQETSSPDNQTQQEIQTPQGTQPITSTWTIPDSDSQEEPLAYTPPSESSALNPIQRGIVSLPSHIEGKIAALKNLGFSDVQVDPQNKKLIVNGKPMDPKPSGVVDFFKDFFGDVGDMAGPALPAIGQIGADVSAIGSGVGLPGLMGINALGAAGGETARQVLASFATGSNQGDVGELGIQGALGASGPFIGAKVLEPVGKVVSNQYGKMVSGIMDKLGNSTPAAYEAIASIPRPVTSKAMELVKSRKMTSSEIASNEIADPQYILDTAKNTFLGNKSADLNPTDLTRQFKNLHDRAAPADKGAIKDMFAQYMGWSPDTVETLVKSPSYSHIINPQTTSDTAINQIAVELPNAINKAREDLGDQIGAEVVKFHNSQKGKNGIIDIDSAFKKMNQDLESTLINPNGLGIVENGKFRTQYGNDKASKMYQEVYDRLGLTKPETKDIYVNGVKVKTTNPNFEARLKTKSPELFKNTNPSASNMSPIDAHRILKDLKPKLNKFFNASERSISEVEKRPLAEFIDNLRNQIGEASPELKQLNAKYRALSQLDDGFLGNLDSQNFKDRQQSISRIKSFINEKDPNKRLEIQDAFKQVDQLVKKPFSERIKTLMAADEIKNTDIKGGLNKFIGDANHLFSTDRTNQVAQTLKAYDAAIPGNSAKFETRSLKHLIAKEFTSSPNGLFASRALAHLTGLYSAIGGATATFGTMAATSPRALGHYLGAFAPKVAKPQGEVSKMVGRQVLSNLLRHAAGK